MRWWQHDRYAASATLEVISKLRPSARSNAASMLVAALVVGVVFPALLASRFTLAPAAVSLPVLVVWMNLANLSADAAVLNGVQVGLAPVFNLAIAVPIEIFALPLALAILACGHRMRVCRANVVAVFAVVGVGVDVGLALVIPLAVAVLVASGARLMPTRISAPCNDEEDESHSGSQAPTSPLMLRGRHRSPRSIDYL